MDTSWEEYMNDPGNFLNNQLLAPFRAQTYLNLIYLFLTFPLGLFYFIFLIVGFSLGISLLIVWIGLLILLIVFAGWWAFVVFERQQAIWLLRVKVPPLTRQDTSGKPAGEQVMAYLTNPVTWKGLIYLLLKFPLGVTTFVIGTVLLALSGTLLGAPLIVSVSPLYLQIEFTRNLVWMVDTLPEALVLFLVGIPVAWVSLIVLNALAWLWARLSEFMLGNQSVSEKPADPGLPVGQAVSEVPAEPLESSSPLVPPPVIPGEPLESPGQN
jgi:hypothetical protein